MMKKKPYYFVRAYGDMMLSSKARIASQVATAQADKAPDSAIYKGLDGWVMLEHLTSPERRSILTNMVVALKHGG